MPAPTSSSPTRSAATRRRLTLHKAEGRTRELNAAGGAARPRRRRRRRAGAVVVAGSVGPTGELFAPLGPLTEAEAVEVFVEQIEGLREGGADLIWIETMSAIEEMRAAATAAARVGMPFTVTASFDTAGSTMMGVHAGRDGARRSPAFAPRAARRRRQLRRRRLRPAVLGAGDDRGRAGRDRHRQGQLRHPAGARRHASTIPARPS